MNLTSTTASKEDFRKPPRSLNSQLVVDGSGWRFVATCPCTHGKAAHTAHGGCEGTTDEGLPCECQAVAR
jgi:hypothetical protein